MIDDLLTALTPDQDAQKLRASTQKLQDDTLNAQLHPCLIDLDQMMQSQSKVARSELRTEQLLQTNEITRLTRQTHSRHRVSESPKVVQGNKSSERIDFAAFASAYKQTPKSVDAAAPQPLEPDSLVFDAPAAQTAADALACFENEIQAYFDIQSLSDNSSNMRYTHKSTAGCKDAETTKTKATQDAKLRQTSESQLNGKPQQTEAVHVYKQPVARFETAFSPEKRKQQPKSSPQQLEPQKVYESPKKSSQVEPAGQPQFKSKYNDWQDVLSTRALQVCNEDSSAPKRSQDMNLTQQDDIDGLQVVSVRIHDHNHNLDVQNNEAQPKQAVNSDAQASPKHSVTLSKEEVVYYQKENDRLRNDIKQLASAYQVLKQEISAAQQQIDNYQAARADIAQRYKTYAKEVQAMLALQSGRK